MIVKKAAEFATLFEATNPAELTRKITAIQTRLVHPAKDKSKASPASSPQVKPNGHALRFREHIYLRHCVGQAAVIKYTREKSPNPKR